MLHATLAEIPAALIGYVTLFGLIARSTLAPQERQAMCLTINVFPACECCAMGYPWLARATKLDEGEILALPAGRLPGVAMSAEAFAPAFPVKLTARDFGLVRRTGAGRCQRGLAQAVERPVRAIWTSRRWRGWRTAPEPWIRR